MLFCKNIYSNKPEEKMPEKIIYLDTETTGLNPPFDKIVEIAIIDNDGNVLMDTFVNPGRMIPRAAYEIHGITDAMVRDAPTLEELLPEIRKIVSQAGHLIIYNADYDTAFFPKSFFNIQIECCMKRFAPIYGKWSAKHKSHSYARLDDAAKYIGYRYEGRPHRALTDAKACRALWLWMNEHQS
jgi:DNA polymerase-3 subunit epsilon